VNSALRFKAFAGASLVGFACVFSLLVIASTAQDRHAQRVVTELTDAVYSISFSRDSRILAIARGARDDNRVELWDTESGTLRRTIRGFDGTVWSASFGPDGRTLVTGSSGIHNNKVAEKTSAHEGRPFTELKWWDIQTGDLKQRLELPEEDLVSVTATHSPDGTLLAEVEHRASTVLITYESRDPAEAGRAARAVPLRRAGLYDANLKLLDASTGELRVKLKDGFNGYEVPLFGGASRADVVSRMTATRRHQPLVFSPDGQMVAAWNSNEIRLWSTVTGKEIRTLRNFKGRLNAGAFSHDGRTLAAAITKYSFKNDQPDFKSEVRIWDLATGAAKQVLPLSTQAVSSLAFALNGQQLLVGGLKREDDRWFATMELADLQTGSLGTLVANAEGNVSSIVLSPNGAMLAFQTDASTVKLVETENWTTKYTCDESSNASSNPTANSRFLLSVKSVQAVGFSPNGKTVAGEIEQGGIKLWDVRTGEVRRALAARDDTGSHVSISTDGSTVAEVSEDQAVRLWNVDSGEHWTTAVFDSPISGVSLSADGKMLGVAYSDRVAIIDNGDHRRKRTFDGIQGKVASLAFSNDGQSLAVATEPGVLKIWDVDSGRLRQTLAAFGILTVRFAPGDRAVATGGKDGRVTLCDLDSGNILREFKKHTAAVNALAFSRDGRLLATGGDDRSVIIWEVATGKSRRTLKGHDVTVSSLAFSADGDSLAVGSGNASVVLWEVSTGKLDRVLK
jgi:WD40 repeat protein